MASRPGPTSDGMLRTWQKVPNLSPKQKDGSSCGVFVLMVRIILLHVAMKEMGTGHKYDKVTFSVSLFTAWCISNNEYMKHFTVSLSQLILSNF